MSFWNKKRRQRAEALLIQNNVEVARIKRPAHTAADASTKKTDAVTELLRNNGFTMILAASMGADKHARR